jgi:predicted HAD superfamily hydrolase
MVDMKTIFKFLYRQSMQIYIKIIAKYSAPRLRSLSSLAAGEYVIASFDVYDTCITRLVGKPASLFHLLAHQCEFFVDKEKPFAEYRIIAEQKAYARHKEKMSLDDIYIQLGESLGLPAESLKPVQSEEIDYEKKLAIPVPFMAGVLANERKKGRHIAFLSDMYLPSEVIQGLLMSAKIWRAGDILLVSNVEGSNKASSLLFRCLKERCGLEGKKIFHRGDNGRADFMGARMAGCEALLENPAKLNRYEEIMESFCASTNGFSSLLAGISRAVRLAHFEDSEYDQTIVSVAAGVASPLLTGYVYWILKEASRMGLQTLYFVSRDGEVLLAIAKQLSVAFEEFRRIELRYLYGSRHAWYPPSIKTAEDLEEAFSTWLSEGRADQTLEAFFQRLNIELEEIEALLIKFGLLELMSKIRFSRSDRKELKAFLLRPEVLSFVLSRSSQYRNNVLAYLRQEGLAGKKKWGLVDLGWQGRLQQKLSAFVREIGGCLPKGFYFALMSLPNPSRYGEYYAYLSLKNFATDGVVNPEVANILEMFCAGSHGVVLGYDTDASGRMKPRLQKEKNVSFHQWGLSCYRNAIMEFCTYLQKPVILEQQWNFEKDMLTSLVNTFWRHPKCDEVKVYGAFVHSSDQKDRKAGSLAECIQLKNILGEFLSYHHPYRLKLFWMAGTLSRSTLIMRGMYVGVHWFARTLVSLVRACTHD